MLHASNNRLRIIALNKEEGWAAALHLSTHEYFAGLFDIRIRDDLWKAEHLETIAVPETVFPTVSRLRVINSES